MSSFNDRQKNLFNQLKDAEDQHSFSKTNKAAPQDYGTIDKHTYKKLKHEMKPFKGRESIYKRPEANLRECLKAKTIPDHIKNPQKYKYYSLADVTPEQMSESTNTATALALIRDMENREGTVKIMTSKPDGDGDGVFKKPTFHISLSLKKPPFPEEKATIKGSKVIMPEYVVGVTKKQEKKVIIINKRINSQDCGPKVELKLQHLFEEGE